MKNNIKLSASEMRKLIPKLVISLQECMEYMESSRCSGDSGYWEWEDNSEYSEAEKVLDEFYKLENK